MRKTLDEMLKNIEVQKENLRAAKSDVDNSCLSDNYRTQNDITVIVNGRRYKLTEMSRETGYLCRPRPGYEMMLLAAKKILKKYIDDKEEEIKELEDGLITAATNRARNISKSDD